MDNTVQNAIDYLKARMPEHLYGGETRQQSFARCMVDYASKVMLEVNNETSISIQGNNPDISDMCTCGNPDAQKEMQMLKPICSKCKKFY